MLGGGIPRHVAPLNANRLPDRPAHPTSFPGSAWERKAREAPALRPPTRSQAPPGNAPPTARLSRAIAPENHRQSVPRSTRSQHGSGGKIELGLVNVIEKIRVRRQSDKRN